MQDTVNMTFTLFSKFTWLLEFGSNKTIQYTVFIYTFGSYYYY